MEKINNNILKIINNDKVRIIKILTLLCMFLTIIYFKRVEKIGLIKEIKIDNEFELEQVSNNIYKTNVKDVDSLNISVVTQNKDTKVEIKGNENLKQGENVIEIKAKNNDKQNLCVINVVKE